MLLLLHINHCSLHTHMFIIYCSLTYVLILSLLAHGRETAAGSVAFVISFVSLCVALVLLVSVLKSALSGHYFESSFYIDIVHIIIRFVYSASRWEGYSVMHSELLYIICESFLLYV